MQNNIVVYENGEIELKVSVDEKQETIWLTQKQIAELFGVNVPAISKHIKNIFKQNELIEDMVVSKMEITTKHGAVSNKTQTKIVNYYNLDMILAIGYRVNSLKAIHFRQWATKVLKQYIINGYVINSEKITVDRFVNLENDIQNLKQEIKEIKENKDKLKLTQGVFFEGEIWDAYEFVNNLLKKAKKEVILIDNYIDDTILTLFSKYHKLNFTIITKNISKQLKLDLQKYNSQYKNLKIKTSNSFHDRFLIIDSTTYHIGASLKDLGKKIFAFSKMEDDIINKSLENIQ